MHLGVRVLSTYLHSTRHRTKRSPWGGGGDTPSVHHVSTQSLQAYVKKRLRYLLVRNADRVQPFNRNSPVGEYSESVHHAGLAGRRSISWNLRDHLACPHVYFPEGPTNFSRNIKRSGSDVTAHECKRLHRYRIQKKERFIQPFVRHRDRTISWSLQPAVGRWSKSNQSRMYVR